MAPRIDFIDVSKWQGSIDWLAVARSGQILGTIAKATEATSVVDAQYSVNRKGCLDNGLLFASYHYLHAGNVEKQMQFYLDVACPVEGERVVLDYEENDPRVRIYDLQAAVEWLRANRPDLQITVYGASMLTDDCLAAGNVAFLEDTSLWAARYSSNYPVVASPPWQTWTAWQFTDDGRCDGIDGPVDLNTFNGSREACIAWFGPAGEIQPLPEPDEAVPVLTTVEAFDQMIEVSVLPDGQVAVTVNGRIWTPLG